MISVVIPAYNAALTIKECIESILRSANGMTEYEIIVINDGSTDKTDSICQEIVKNNSRVRYYSKLNGGVSSARNFGIEHAKGDHISFVDADDIVLPEYLSTIITIVNDIDITFFGFKKHTVTINETSDMIPLMVKPTTDKGEIQEAISWLMKNTTVNFFGFTWSKIFRSDIIKKHGVRFNSELKIKEDEIFTLEYCKHINSLQVIPNILYHYNIFASSLSHSKTRIRYDILCKTYSFLASGFDCNNLRKVLIDNSVSYALGYARDLKRAKAKKHNVKEIIINHVLPLISQGYGLDAARWMPYVIKYIPKYAKADAIYLFLR